MKIAILDYGIGNIGSLFNMLKKIGVQPEITNNINLLKTADALILPGVGAFDNAMKKLNEMKLIDILNDLVLNDNKPILGVCLGMQMLGNTSEESADNNIVKGLGWLAADTKKLRHIITDVKVKIPHMGWNYVKPQKDFFLFENINDQPRFYFAHSYYMHCADNADILATAVHGNIEFTVAIRHKNIAGVQFHPEKSHRFGLNFLKNFFSNLSKFR